MAQPDMHDVLLGQYQRQYDADCDNEEKLEAAEFAAYSKAYDETLAATLAKLRAGGADAVESMQDFDCATSHADLLGGYEILASVMSHFLEGNYAHVRLALTTYHEAIARSEADSAGLAAMADVASQALRRAA
jgi:hypothetical protein